MPLDPAGTDTQLDAPAYALPPRGPSGAPEPEQYQSGWDVTRAAFQSSNYFAQRHYEQDLDKRLPPGEAVAGFDPLAHIKPEYQMHQEAFALDESPQDMLRTETRLDHRAAVEKTLRSAGKVGTIAEIGAGLLDPFSITAMAIPITAEARLARMAQLALIGAGTSLAEQEALKSLHEGPESAGQEAAGIAASALLGGTLGGLIGGRGEVNRLRTAATRELANVPPAGSAEDIFGAQRGNAVPPGPWPFHPPPTSDAADIAADLRNAAQAAVPKAPERPSGKGGSVTPFEPAAATARQAELQATSAQIQGTLGDREQAIATELERLKHPPSVLAALERRYGARTAEVLAERATANIDERRASLEAQLQSLQAEHQDLTRQLAEHTGAQEQEAEEAARAAVAAAHTPEPTEPVPLSPELTPPVVSDAAQPKPTEGAERQPVAQAPTETERTPPLTHALHEDLRRSLATRIAPEHFELANFGLAEPPITLPQGHELLLSHANNVSPERLELRERLIDQRFAGAIAGQAKPVAIFFSGGGASGKGTVKKSLAAAGQLPKGAVELDPDEFKTGHEKKGLDGLPEYKQIVAAGDSRAAAVTHDESKLLYDQALRRAIEGRYHLILDRTLSDPAKARIEVQALKDAGYEVHEVAVSVHPDSAVVRMVKRAEGPEKRYVPTDAMLKAHKEHALGWAERAHLFEHSRLLDNNVPRGTPAKIMAEQRLGSAAGLVIHLPESYNEFVRKGNLNEKATTFAELYGPAAPPGEAGRGAGLGPEPLPTGGGAEGAGGAGERGAQQREPGAGGVPRPRVEQVLTAAGRRIEVRHKLVEAVDLLTSENPNYPAGLQPRDRKGRASSEAQVADIAMRLNPEQLGAAPEADRGAPIVGPDNAVESGNGRVMALRQVYEGRYANSPEKAAAYRAHLESLGYDVKGMKAPVLVRERTSALSPTERQQFAIEANSTSVGSLSPVERAQADAHNLDAITMDKLQPGELTTVANAPFVRAFAELIPASERNAYVDAHNVLSQAGEARLQAAILAKAYGGTEASNVTLGRMLESTDDSMKSTLNALQDAAPKFAKLRQAIADGTVDERFDITPAIVSAVEDVAKLRASGTSLAEHLATADMFAPKSLAVRAFYSVDGRLVGRDKAAAALEKYADAAIAQRTDQASLFSTEAFSPAELMRHAVVPRSGDLFGLRGEPAPEEPETVAEPTRGYKGKSVTAADGQIAFDFAPHIETRATTSRTQVALGRAALGSLLARRDSNAGASILANGLTREFTAQGHLSLVGQHPRTPGDFAALAQVYRDPRFETLRFFLTDDSGAIVHQYGGTSRLAGAVSFSSGWLDTLASTMRLHGATGYWMQHNHPSGNPEPSMQDVMFTTRAANVVPGFKGHIIVNRNSYGHIEGHGESRVVSAPHLGGYSDPYVNPTLAHPLLAAKVESPEQLAVVAKQLEVAPGNVTLIATDSRGFSKVLADFPKDMLSGSEKGGVPALARIRRIQREAGAGGHVFLVGKEADLKGARPLARSGIVADMFMTDAYGQIRITGARAAGLQTLATRQRSYPVSYPQPDIMGHSAPEARLPAAPFAISEPDTPYRTAEAGNLEDKRLGRGARIMAEGTIGRVAPGLRALGSPSFRVRQLTQELVNIPELTNENYRGVPSPSPIERQLWRYDGIWHQSLRERGRLFKTYRQRLAAEGGSPLTRQEWDRQVSFAMRRGDRSDIPEVATAAVKTRATVFQPLYERALKAGLIPAQADIYAESYLMRQYDGRAIRAHLAAWHALLTDAFEEQLARDPARADMFKDSAEQRGEAERIAHDVTRNVLGGERGTMDWHILDGVPHSGQMTGRTLRLPDEKLEPFLNQDINHLTHAYLRSMAPEVEFTERFGSRDLKQQLEGINDEYAVLKQRALAAGDEGKANDLLKQQNQDFKDIALMRDRLYGIYGQPKNPGSFFVRAARLLRGENALRLLGAATLAHFPDIANTVLKFGAPRTFGAMVRLGTSLEAFKLARDTTQRMGAALDMTMNATASMLGDYAQHSQYLEQRLMNRATRFFTILTGETPLITLVQGLTGVLAQDEILRSAAKLANMQTVPKGIRVMLAGAGLSTDELAAIAEEHGRFGLEARGLQFGASELWHDQKLAAKFESAVLRFAHGVTLRPGAGDTPGLMSTEWGKTILQFTSFAFAASRSVVNPLAQGLAHGDYRSAQALICLLAAGYLAYYTKQKVADQPIETDPTRLGIEVVDKSNLVGWTGQFLFPMLWQFGMKNLSRWSDRDPVETLLGPTAGTVASAYTRQFPGRIFGNPNMDEEGGEANLQFRRSDLHFLRRMAPGQNIWYLRHGINQLEDSIGDAFDLPGQSEAQRAAERHAQTQ